MMALAVRWSVMASLMHDSIILQGEEVRETGRYFEGEHFEPFLNIGVTDGALLHGHVVE